MARRKRGGHTGFAALASRVAAEYRRKGVSAATARKWGRATAGKVRAQQRRRTA